MYSWTFREARPDDQPEIIALFKHTIQHINIRHYDEEQISAWKTRGDDHQKWVARIEQQYFIVAEEEQTIIGFGCITTTGYLDLLYVHHNHQGRGIASAIVHKLIQFAQETGARKIKTRASITSKPFFQKMGFSVLKENQADIKGAKLTNYIMTKPLP